MKTLHEIQKDREDNISKLLTETGVFFAFSNEQFNENKTPKKDNEKYVSVGMGGYMPKSNAEAYLSGMKSIMDTFKREINETKQREKYILYELNNHEAFYTHDIESTMDALIGDYTTEEVSAVFKKYKAKKYELCG